MTFQQYTKRFDWLVGNDAWHLRTCVRGPAHTRHRILTSSSNEWHRSALHVLHLPLVQHAWSKKKYDFLNKCVCIDIERSKKKTRMLREENYSHPWSRYAEVLTRQNTVDNVKLITHCFTIQWWSQGKAVASVYPFIKYGYTSGQRKKWSWLGWFLRSICFPYSHNS